MVLRAAHSNTRERAVPYRQDGGAHPAVEEAGRVTMLALKAKEHIPARFTHWSVGLQQRRDQSKLLWNRSLSCSSINCEAGFFCGRDHQNYSCLKFSFHFLARYINKDHPVTNF